MSDTVLPHADDFIPGTDAARLVGYTSDYIAKLAREGKIAAIRKGKSWTVSRSSLLSFKEKTDQEKLARSEMLRAERLREQQFFSPKTPIDAIEDGVTGARPTLIPVRTPISKMPALIKTIALLVLGLTTGVLSYTAVLQFSDPSYASVTILDRVAALLSSGSSPQESLELPTQTLEDTSVGAVTNAVQPVPQESSEDRVPSSVSSVTATATATATESYIIAPADVLTEERVDTIRNSLSDDVEIIPDPDHPDSGVIIPQFKDGEGESYRFLTVPVQSMN